MNTSFVSLLPFLKALQRNQNMPDDDDDGTPPLDQFGRVLPLQGNGVPPQSANTGRSGDPGVAPGASQNSLGQTDALRNYQGQSNSIDDLVYRMAPGSPPQLMQLLQAGMQSSEPKQSQATNGLNGTTSQSDLPGGNTAQTPAQLLPGQLPGVSESIPSDLFLPLSGPPTLAPQAPTLTVKNVAGCGGADFFCNTLFKLDSPSEAGGYIIQKIDRNNAAVKPYWEAWHVNKGSQYTDIVDPSKADTSADDRWSSRNVTASARFYEGLTDTDLSRMGFEVGKVPEAGDRPSTDDDPSRFLSLDHASKEVTRTFP